MQPTTTTLTLPFSPQAFYTLVLFVALVLGSGLVFALLHGPHHKRPSVIERVRSFFQLDQLPLGVVFLGVLLWVMLFTTLFIGLIYVITEAVRTPYPEGVDDRWNFRFALAKLTAITAVIGALIAFPFTVWRIRLTREQIRIADATRALTDTSLFNEKFSAAATGLAARKQVTQIAQKGDSKTVLTEWADDLVSRAIAIEQLEGLAKERPAEAPRIARILSAYLAEVSRDHPAKHLVPQSDMQKAAQTMGRIRTISSVALGEVGLDVRFCNLQGCDLKNLNFDRAMMQDARLQGACMWGTQMQGARLWDAQMQGAGLIGAQMQEADLTWAQMQGAGLIGAQMQGANLMWAQMQGADLRKTEFDAETKFHGADLSGALIRSVDFSHTGISAKQLNSAFGDGSTALPAGMARPAHWPQAGLRYSNFLNEYRKWQENPTTYAPPAP